MQDETTDPIAARALRLAIGIGAAYAVAGIAWIFLSDALVAGLAPDAAWLAAAQRYKGVLYVLATGAGLVLLVRAGYRRLFRTLAQAQRALRRQESQFRQLHQSLGEVLWLASADGREVLYVSPAFQALYGRPAVDFQRDPDLWLACVHPDDRALAEASSRQLDAEGESSCEYRIRRADGSQRWVADRKKAIVDDEGRVTMIGGIAEDITAAHERDMARVTMQAELEQRVAERTAELERVNVELDAFTRTAAHDLRSPLNAVAGFAELLRLRHADGLGPDGLQMAAQIARSAQHMASLINDLLSLSRVTTTELRLSEVDLAAMAREIVGELRQQQPERHVDFEAPPRLPVRCDAGLARSLLANLLGNAWKFSGKREHGWIALSAADTAHGLQISVADNGAGFDASNRSQLFKPFQRFHAASDFGGTGIGLVTCQRIVQRHGGTIDVDSAPGQGATFRFTLGRAAEAATA